MNIEQMWLDIPLLQRLCYALEAEELQYSPQDLVDRDSEGVPYGGAFAGNIPGKLEGILSEGDVYSLIKDVLKPRAY